MTRSIANTEWEGEFSQQDGTLMSVICVKFKADNTAEFKVRRHRTGEWSEWVKGWTWRQSGSQVHFGRKEESYDGTVDGDSMSGTGKNYGDPRKFWMRRIG
jgi:hypothetical protein